MVVVVVAAAAAAAAVVVVVVVVVVVGLGLGRKLDARSCLGMKALPLRWSGSFLDVLLPRHFMPLLVPLPNHAISGLVFSRHNKFFLFGYGSVARHGGPVRKQTLI